MMAALGLEPTIVPMALDVLSRALAMSDRPEREETRIVFAGHMVDAVPDGEAALASSQAAEYDLLLADVVMPGIDGIELARRVAARQPGIKVMFITGFAAVALQDEGFGAHLLVRFPQKLSARPRPRRGLRGLRCQSFIATV